jgi:hypothetical protein
MFFEISIKGHSRPHFKTPVATTIIMFLNTNRHFTITWNGLQVGWPLPVIWSPWKVSILDQCTRHPLIKHRVLWFVYKDIMCRWPEMQQYSITRTHLVFIMLVLQWTFLKTHSDVQSNPIMVHCLLTAIFGSISEVNTNRNAVYWGTDFHRH